MANGELEITPSARINDLLDAYPELEETLINMAPPFKKLKNPFLRRAVGKVATLKHVSSVGHVPLNELINELREAVGQPVTTEVYESESYYSDRPDWFSADKIVVSINEEEVKDKDKMTLVAILRESQQVKQGEIIELITTFLPAPGIDTMKAKGYSVWTREEAGGVIKSYFLKNTD